jgi:glutathione S-transferase
LEAIMSLILYGHPLAAFCWKALIALYETETPFEFRLVNLGDEAERAAFLKISPFGKMPALEDMGRGKTVIESSLVIEYLGGMIPADADQARECRLWDRIFDLYVASPMQAVVTDRRRPADAHHPAGVAEAKASLRHAYGVIEGRLADGRRWIMGEAFTLADCAACPALFYGDLAEPLDAAAFPKTAAYLERLKARPSFARVLVEAEPYFQFYPRTDLHPAPEPA